MNHVIRYFNVSLSTAFVVTLALLFASPSALAQSGDVFTEIEAPYHLVYEGNLHSGGSPHGVVTDSEDKIWISYNGSGEGIYVFNPDGTQVSFSPIESVSIDGQTISTTAGGRGVAVDHEGNIIAVVNDTQLIRINAETGEGMALYEGPGSLTAPAVDSEGFVYTSQVLGTPPIFVLDIQQGLNQTQVIEPSEATAHLSRAVEVGDGGATVYSGECCTNNESYVWRYTTTDNFVSYDQVNPPIGAVESESFEDGDSTFFEGRVSSLDWGPAGPDGGMLWATDDGNFATDELLSTRNIKVLNVNDKTYFSLRSDSLGFRPRGVAFAGTGTDDVAVDDTIYVASFNEGYIQKFSIAEGPPPVDVEDVPRQQAHFALADNFPNPVSSSGTTIRYRLKQPATVTLRIYDALGRRVKTLVANQPTSADVHTARWNGTSAGGSAVSSGVYFYTLEANGRRRTKAMTVVR